MTQRLRACAPILLVTDVEASADYYRDKLGFTYDRFYGDPPSFCILHREGCHIMLSLAPGPDHVVPHWRVVDKMWNVYIWVDEVDALYGELRARGATIDYDLGDKPYGCPGVRRSGPRRVRHRLRPGSDVSRIRRRYSYRSASIGFIRDARRAG